MPLKKQPIKIAQKEFKNLQRIDFADTGENYDIDLLNGSDFLTGKP